MVSQSFANFTSNISDVPSSTGPTSYLSNVLITFFIVIFFIFSFIGNLLTVATIKSNSHLQNISNSFIASLCVSDLISTIICSPLWLYRRTWGYSDWQWSNFLCESFYCLVYNIKNEINGFPFQVNFIGCLTLQPIT